MADLFSAGAKWIWIDKPPRAVNQYACFRRTIELAKPPKAATVRITADSRYELYVNGHFVGHGPPRAWPSLWPVDEYAIGHLLVAGRNVVGVLVTHYGISTFQYLDNKPGLIAQIELDEQTIATNGSWKAAPHEGYLWPAPRISCQHPREEQLDARIAPGLPQEWSSASFDDAKWSAAKVLEQPPHDKFEARTIPMLTLEPVEPLNVRSVEVVRPADYTFSLNPRELINATDRSANHINARMLLATFIHSDRAQKVDFHQPHTRPFLPWKLNGTPLKFDDHSTQKTDVGVAHASLKAGWNALMVRLPESEHHYWANMNVWVEQPVMFSAKPASGSDSETAWMAFGPFEGPIGHGFDKILVTPTEIPKGATGERFESIWKSAQPGEKDLSEPFARVMKRDMVATTDAYAICVSDRVESSFAAEVDAPGAMMTDNAEWTTFHPAHDGASVRALFDFGREIVGFHEFEIDAPAGTIVDFHNFEFIQRDGRFNLNESVNNSFRYICRDGVQRYRTFLRRGLKYSWMTLRDFKRPVRVRMVRVLQSTYPQTGVGSFECSDKKLEEIWRVGVRSVRCCSEDTYTDCPTYEQTLWVGDARNEALVDLVANGDPRLSEHCLRIIGRSLDRSPIVESQVPSGWQNLLPTWTFLWMRWAQEHYQLVGNKEFGREMLAFLDRNIAGMKKAINDRGLFAMFGWNLFDWAPMDTPGDGIVTHINCLASLGLTQCAQLARDLGDESKANDWDKAARGLADAVNKHLWSDAKNAYVDCIHADGSISKVFSQQTQTAAFISGVATGDRATKCAAAMHNPPKGFVKAGSPFFMFFLLEALVREQKYDALIDTIRDYWGKQIDAGATTFWEMYHEGSGRLTRSHCHGWSAAPTFFLTQYVLGVQPIEPGYARVAIAPKLGNLAWAQGRVPTPRGVIECYWKNSDKAFELTVSLPAGVGSQIDLPVTGEVKFVNGEGEVKGQTITSKSPRLRVSVAR